MMERFDIVVVGGGHAGIEASLAAARMGGKTLLVSMGTDSIGRMSCNPAIGGTAKGHLVREIDALGGEMGKIADATGIHFRMLNRSKGPAVWSPRCQSDREWYSREAGRRIRAQEGLTMWNGLLTGIQIEKNRVNGIGMEDGRSARCLSLVLCSGTFLNGLMHTGETTSVGGRFGEPASHGISEELKRHGLLVGRLKTGTPPRIDRSSIDFSETEEQLPDEEPVPFSFQNDRITNRQVPMYLTYTNMETHAALREGFDRSPLFSGKIKGIGPRYCPSIEDKLFRFAGKDRHQLFLEPEGYDSPVVYVNGFSTSLPEDIQRKAIATVRGLEKARVIRPGYAVEYDYFPPHQLRHTLETRAVKGLFFAGQINGTSGYEEAAAQGLVAGINAALSAKGETECTYSRSESYIGVLVDDLINKSTDEPYRMFTSRAEYRLALRQDNADSRLMRRGSALGLISKSSIDRLQQKEDRIAAGIQALREMRVSRIDLSKSFPDGSESFNDNEIAFQLLKRPEVGLETILKAKNALDDPRLHILTRDRLAREGVQTQVKYEGYLKRQEEQVRQFERNEGIRIPGDFDYSVLRALSREGLEKFNKIRPESIGQAARISGVTPADVSIVMVRLMR